MATENHSKPTNNDPKKRKRRYLPHNKAVKKKGSSPLRPGVQGFFITCDGGREFQASNEAINVIESFFEDLINGEDSSTNTKSIPIKPVNKKITFNYSDSSDEEDEDDENADKSEEDKSKKPEENDATNGNKVEEEISDSTKKENNELNKECFEQGKGDDVEGGEKKDDDESKEDEEPPEKKQCCHTKKGETENHKSVDQLIEEELKELGDKSKRRFSKIDSGCNGVVLIQMRRRDGDPSPGDILKHLMESASATKKHISRFILRILPVEISCYASEEEISRAMKPLIDQYFPADAESPVKFAVQYDARANTGIERMKIIDAVAKSVPGPHKVDLKNPDKTIIVQVVKTVCLIGVVEKYKELAKYNLRQLTS